MAEAQELENEDQIELDLGEESEVDVASNDDVEASSDDDNFDKAESATQKRIDRLTKKMREAERQREEALRYAQGVQTEAQKLKARMDALDTSYVSEYSSRVETQMATAEQDLARAIEMGDTNGVVEAQRKITKLAIENDRAQQAKVQQERYAQQARAQQEARVNQPMPQQQPRRPDPKAERWAQRNAWFGEDEAMTYAAFGIHKKLIEDEGFDRSPMTIILSLIDVWRESSHISCQTVEVNDPLRRLLLYPAVLGAVVGKRLDSPLAKSR